MKKATQELLELMKSKHDYNDYLKEQPEFIDITLPDYLEQLLIEKQLTRAEVVRRSGLDRPYVYQIFRGERNPSRDKLLAIGLAMELGIEQMQQFLKIIGLPQLYIKNRRDSILLFCLEQRVCVMEANELLYECGEGILE